jgi:hypothetical protein
VREPLRRQRPVLIGELPSLPARTWVPEVLRDLGPRTMPQAELEAARRAFVNDALVRRIEREVEHNRCVQHATVEELLTPVSELLAELGPRSDFSESEMRRLKAAHASHIWMAAATTFKYAATGSLQGMERPAEAIAALRKLRAAALKLGPLAEQTLDLAGELLKLETYLKGRPRLVTHEYLLVDKIDAAMAALQPYVTKGQREPGGAQPRGARIADQVARAYAEITGELPPMTNPHHVDPMHERPYHRLVRSVFRHYRQGNWKECAKEAAKRLHEIGSRRHLRTARPGRSPRSAVANKEGRVAQ